MQQTQKWVAQENNCHITTISHVRNYD